MARPNNGHLVEERTKRGTSYAIRFSLGGRRRYHLIGGAWDGWTRERAKKGRLYLLGHTDSSFTMRVYQQVLDMGEGAVEALENLLGEGLDEARSTYSGRGVLPVNCQSPRKIGSSGGGISLQQGSDSRDLQAEQ